ncbi:MAG: hypothetical protein R3Y57_03390 [Erysipelotrichaceae bacterium]
MRNTVYFRCILMINCLLSGCNAKSISIGEAYEVYQSTMNQLITSPNFTVTLQQENRFYYDSQEIISNQEMWMKVDAPYIELEINGFNPSNTFIHLFADKMYVYIQKEGENIKLEDENILLNTVLSAMYFDRNTLYDALVSEGNEQDVYRFEIKDAKVASLLNLDDYDLPIDAYQITQAIFTIEVAQRMLTSASIQLHVDLNIGEEIASIDSITQLNCSDIEHTVIKVPDDLDDYLFLNE